MTFPHASKIDTTALAGMKHLGSFISNLQLKSGAIPSNKDGSHDPWDHLEAVMGLSTLGFNHEAMLGLQWMKDNQNEDGSWYNLYQGNEAIEKNKQSNFSTYIAVAVWQNYLLTNDLQYFREFLELY